MIDFINASATLILEHPVLSFIFNSLWIFGFYAASSVDTKVNPDGTVIIENEESKNILWRVKYYSLKWFSEYWSKPIATCPICMSSYHSIIIWFAIYYVLPFHWTLLLIHLFYITCLAGLNKIILYLENL